MSTSISIPAGWYAVAFSDEIKPMQVIPRNLAGHELAVFRTRSGKAAVLSAYCPHLGAHLGWNGSVVDEYIQCTFHGFRFAADGGCVATGYDTKVPPTARLTSWQVREMNQAIFVYYHPLAEAPGWEIPRNDEDGWTRYETYLYRLHGHVQDVAENSVDTGHFVWTHKYSHVESLAPLTTDGPNLQARYRFRRTQGVVGPLGSNLPTEIAINQWGLGSAVVTSYLPMGMLARHLVYATPTRPGEIEIRLGLAFKGRVPPGIGQLIRHLVFSAFVKDVGQDCPIWEHKQMLDRPALAAGDGPIGPFRRWSRQFYATESATAQ